jgi:hypothetical protein
MIEESLVALKTTCEMPSCRRRAVYVRCYDEGVYNGLHVVGKVCHCGGHSVEELNHHWDGIAVQKSLESQQCNPMADCKKLMRKRK